jgi:hypothetical protein
MIYLYPSKVVSVTIVDYGNEYCSFYINSNNSPEVIYKIFNNRGILVTILSGDTVYFSLENLPKGISTNYYIVVVNPDGNESGASGFYVKTILPDYYTVLKTDTNDPTISTRMRYSQIARGSRR